MCNRPRNPQRKPKPRASLRFGLELEAGIVDRELFQGLAQLAEVLAVRRIQAAIDHPLRLFVAGQRRRGVVAGNADRVADVDHASAT